ncbi:MAG: DNA replication/repair protein RecF [Cyanobacteria bacterium P01_G01_bin.54]
MYLHSLYLQDFRNYREQRVTFEAPKTIIVGPNAQGKSNLLEAVELLATLRSHRVSRDRDLVRQQAQTARIEAQIQRSYGDLDAALILRTQGRRTAWRNQETLRRQLDFLGTLNAVQFSCTDLELVRGGPETRRHWLDALVMQLEPVYAHILSQYNKVLKQRNALLRKLKRGEMQRRETAPQLAVWDAQLVAHGTRVTRRRARVLRRLAPIAQTWQQRISGAAETLTTAYQPHVVWREDEVQAVQQLFLQQLQQRAIAEQHQGRTLVGPHRDEIAFQLNDVPARTYASQGQQRTLVLALKLAELELIEQVVGDAPLLLLDDVLAELDLQRQHQLLETIQARCQTLITTTHLQTFASDWLHSAQVLAIQDGQVSPANFLANTITR